MLVHWWLLYVIVLRQTEVVIAIDKEREQVSVVAERGGGRQFISAHDFDGGDLAAAFGLLNVTHPNRYGEYETNVRLFSDVRRMTLAITHGPRTTEIGLRFEKPFSEACVAMAERQMQQSLVPSG
jgi:hypothetical protein